MKNLIITLCLIAATAQASDKTKFIVQEDAKDCTIDALNYTGLAFAAKIIDNQVDWDKFTATQIASTHTELQQEWVKRASNLAWLNKGHGSPVAQGVLMYDSCVKTLEIPLT